jgi:GDP/UDP-N,N'-diacetylbacillosamine 2-epimerase (hydrolysing)
MYFLSNYLEKKYFNIIRHSSGITGNSSSGVCEVPCFKVGTLNLGKRQTCRIRIKSVINSEFTKQSIIKGIKKILSKNFKLYIKNIKNPYYKKNSSQKII